MTTAPVGDGAAGAAADAVSGDEGIISERLIALLEDILAGRAPNAGRFCGCCYHPLAPQRTACPHCGRSTSEAPPAQAVPRELVKMYSARRTREGLVVRAIAWGGLSLGLVLSLLPIAFAGVELWAVLAFFGILGFFYLLSANLANSLGDALGYRWGQFTFRRRWQRFVAERDRTTTE